MTSIHLESANPEMQDRGEIFRLGQRTVLAVADGAGGIAGGAEAAELFIKFVREKVSMLESVTDCVDLLRIIDCELERKPECGETTGVIVVIEPSALFGASVGDSSAKLFTADDVEDLTLRQRRKPFLGTGCASAEGFNSNTRHGTIVVATDGLWKYTSSELIQQCVNTSAGSNLATKLSTLVRMPSGIYPDDIAILSCRIG